MTIMQLDLNDRVAIVTGGGTGIGKAIAVELSRQGARVIICGQRPDPLHEVVKYISGENGSASARQLDVSSASQVATLVDEIYGGHGRIDILVNNAGVSGGGHIHEHDVAVWDRTMAVNLRGPFLLARHVLPHMREQHSGHIINISSEAGLEYYRGSGSYGVAKHALNALGEYIQRENQDLGIRVDTICPGMVVTPMAQGARGLNEDKCLYPEDIADLVIWLLTRRDNVKIGRPILIQTMENPWQ
jgi:NAD(P)-dependent dehydrogenase (short-subunit alcohol dehydrogenase family)